MEENKLTPEQETAQADDRFSEMLDKAMEKLSEQGAELKEEAAEMAAEVKEEIAEFAEEVKEEIAEAVEAVAEASEDTAEETDGKKKKKAKRVPTSLFIGVGALEWLSTLSFCGVIMLLGYLMGQAVQTGAKGMELLSMGLSNWYSNVQVIALAVFGVLYITLVKKHSARWLCIPALAFVATAVWISVAQAIIPGIEAYNVLLEYITTAEARTRLMRDLIRSLIPMLLPYIIQIAMVIGFCIIAFGRGCRWVQLAWCLAWTGLMCYNIIDGLKGGFVKMAPQLMMVLAMVTIGALFALPGFVGKKVAKADFAELRVADIAAYAASKNKTAAAAETAAAETVAEEIPAEEAPVEEAPVEEAPVEETPVEE